MIRSVLLFDQVAAIEFWGSLTISNALQWLLQYRYEIAKAGLAAPGFERCAARQSAMLDAAGETFENRFAG